MCHIVVSWSVPHFSEDAWPGSCGLGSIVVALVGSDVCEAGGWWVDRLGGLVCGGEVGVLEQLSFLSGCQSCGCVGS